MIFEGLDTHADVYLNEQLILKANNQHREWKVNVKNLLKEKNTLRVYFYSAVKQDTAAQAKIWPI